MHSTVLEELKNLQNHYHAKFDTSSSWDTEKSLLSVFEFYRNRMGLMEKIEMQNRKLKEKLEEVDEFKGGKGMVDGKEIEKRDGQIAQLNRHLNDISSKFETLKAEFANKEKTLASKMHEIEMMNLEVKDRRHAQSKL